MTPELTQAEIDEAIAVIRGGLGKYELEFVASITAPIFWVLRENDKELLKNGSIFFLDTGESVFGVTAAHVVTECLKDSKSPTFVQCMIGRDGQNAFPFHLGDRVIDAHEKLDIATLRFTREEVEHIGRTVVSNYNANWPPRLAEVDGGATYCGYPGTGRRWLAKRELSFGIVPMAGIVTNSHETLISIQIERENLFQVLGTAAMPDNFDFRGMSGGPVIAIVQTKTLRLWKPAGVIVQGPNTSDDPAQAIQGLEIIRARPIHFINRDGTLDIERWEQGNPLG